MSEIDRLVIPGTVMQEQSMNVSLTPELEKFVSRAFFICPGGRRAAAEWRFIKYLRLNVAPILKLTQNYCSLHTIPQLY